MKDRWTEVEGDDALWVADGRGTDWAPQSSRSTQGSPTPWSDRSLGHWFAYCIPKGFSLPMNESAGNKCFDLENKS